MSCRFAALLFVFSSLILSGCATLPATAQATVSTKKITYYSRPGNGPTLIFQSGLGDDKSVWSAVINKLPNDAAILAYDRPGYGDSPGTEDTRDPCSLSRELHELLMHTGTKPPYILVGHSLGGLMQYCFAKLYPSEVAGLVLLDPTHPRHWEQMKQDAPLQSALINTLRITAFTKVMRQEFEAQSDCVDALDKKSLLPQPTRLLFSSQFQLSEKGPFERMVRSLRTEWDSFFSHSIHTEIENSGHYIQKDAPEAVIEAIKSIKEEISRRPS